MTKEQIIALKDFIYWSCRHAVAEATRKHQGEYRRMCEAENTFDAAMKATPCPPANEVTECSLTTSVVRAAPAAEVKPAAGGQS